MSATILRRVALSKEGQGGIVIRDGTFTSPLAKLPDASRQGHVRALLPRTAR